MNQITLNANKIARFLVIIEIILIIASVTGQISTYQFGHDNLRGFVPLFKLNQENNIPTYFTVLLIVTAAFLLFLIAIICAKKNAPYLSKWVILAVGSLYLAFDEAFQVHETFSGIVGNASEHSGYGIFYFSWVIIGIPVVLLLFLFFGRFLFNLPKRTRNHFLIASIIYLTGCLGFEMIGGWYAELYGETNLSYNLIATVEESLEMAGMIFFIWSLLQYLADNYQEVLFRFGKTGDTAQHSG